MCINLFSFSVDRESMRKGIYGADCAIMFGYFKNGTINADKMCVLVLIVRIPFPTTTTEILDNRRTISVGNNLTIIIVGEADMGTVLISAS